MDGEPLKSGALSFTDQFERACPYYMSIGMSYEQFWDGEPKLCVYYRKAHDLRNKQRNQELWLQGMYFAHALNSTVGNMFSKQKSKYPAEPIPITQSEITERKEREQRAKMEKIKASFMTAALRLNNRRTAEHERSNDR